MAYGTVFLEQFAPPHVAQLRSTHIEVEQMHGGAFNK